MVVQATCWSMQPLSAAAILQDWMPAAFRLSALPEQDMPDQLPSMLKLLGRCTPQKGHLSCPQNSSTTDAAWVNFIIKQPLAQLPEGSQTIKTSNRTWLLAPIGNIIEEKYTSYFEFQGPAPSLPA